MTNSNHPPPSTFHEKLNRLFDEQLDPHRKQYTNAQIVARINAFGGVTITESYLSLLRSGKRPEPRLSVVEAIAKAFGVSATYFLSEPPTDAVSAEERLRQMVAEHPELAGQAELLLAFKSAGVTRVGARGAQFTDEGRRSFTRLVQTVGRLPENAVDAVLRVAEVMADTTSNPPKNDDAR
ncbi:helix-turn-helix domain-containing protein [Micromonospora haikouensis]|uniref:helix-turn-helix domain-containing protein n=1 Tax=Micromonospora haikouensis TaxID=686309 RepID=UPI003D73AF00